MLRRPAAGDPGTDQLVTQDGLIRHRFNAMGTTVTVLLPKARGAEATRVERLFATWQAICTRFDPLSELSRLNAARGEPIVVGELLFHVLSTSIQAASATDGLFDPTLLRSLEAIGYDRDFEVIAAGVPTRSTPSGAVPATGGWRAIRLDPERRTAQLPVGVGVDLGGLAKGMAVDAAIVDLAARGVEVMAVDAGGDLAVIGQPPGAEAWSISIEAPGQPRTISLRSGALATSSIARRRWRQGTLERHHLIDPRTGLPSTVELYSASIAAPSCAQAEAAAKAAFLLGLVDGSRFLAERGLAGLFLTVDGTAQPAGPWTEA
jgi:thiamine biosynthesis lipoprotein